MKKIKTEKVVLFAAISKDVYERLREIRYRERKSIAQITREAIDLYLKNKKK